MSKNSNKNKDLTLGMPHGTAAHRLRKNVMFHLLKKHGENVCFKCSKIIDKVSDLSLDHKKPWEGVSADLFWDLENIAFSHMFCNRPDRPNSVGPSPIVVPEGTIWCGACKSPKPSTEFTSGAKNQCSSCKAKINALRDRRKIDVRQADTQVANVNSLAGDPTPRV